MTTLDEHLMRAPADICFQVAADVERWPVILSHYRFVRVLDRNGPSRARVEMAAWRDFGGPLRYPTRWTSEMRLDPRRPLITYRHVAGITRGMYVRWEFHPEGDATRVRITHAWDGPPWPLIGGFAWRRIIAPHFVSAIARRTLAGVAAEAERLARDNARAPRADSTLAPSTPTLQP
jgi:uncharacterized membrane protein